MSVGAGVTLVNSATAKSLESTQGVASTKQFRDSDLPVGVVTAVSREISRSYRISQSQLRVVSFSQQDWSDSCLGLGQANESCAQVFIKNGWRVVMSDSSQTWTYRTDNTARFVRLESLGNSSNNSLPDTVTNAVLRAASAQSGLSTSQLKITKSQQQNWPDRCLGLPNPTELCASALTPGWRVSVESKQLLLVYHTDRTGSLIRLNKRDSTITNQNTDLPQSVADLVLRTASGRTGLRVSDLRIVGYKQITVDGCLGLPRPGEACTEIAQQAWEVTVEGGKQRLVYRVSQNGSQIRLNERASNISDANLPQSLADIVLRTASQRTGLRISDLRIVKSEQITVDGCLGLPRPGEGCTRIAQQAWEVTVEGGKQRLIYRINQSGSQIRLNEKASNVSDVDLPQSIATAVLRFAARDLGVSGAQLQITKAEQQTWGDRCLGMPRPTERCMGTPTPGWRVTVQGRRRVQVYRTDSTGFQIRAEENAGSGGSQGTIKPIPIPTSEIPPLGEDVIFRAISSGGFAGIYSETFLMNDGRVMRQMRQFSSPRITTPTQIYQLSRQEVRQFQQLLEQQQFSGFNRLSYPAPNGAADFITVTLSSQSGTTRYVDMIQNQLPESLQSVIQAWNQIATRR